MLASLEHELGVVEQLLVTGGEPEPIDVEHRPPRAGGLQELEAERAPAPCQLLELAGRLVTLLAQPADLRQLRLGLLRLRLLVAEPLDEALEPLDVLVDPLHTVFAACVARAAFSRRHWCHGPEK